MKKGGILVFVFVIVLLTSGCTSETKYETQTAGENTKECPVVILDHHAETDEYGGYYVVGTAQNTGDKQLSYVEIRVRFLDKDGALLQNGLDNAIDLGPQMKWKFKVYYFGEEKPASYEIGIGNCW